MKIEGSSTVRVFTFIMQVCQNQYLNHIVKAFVSHVYDVLYTDVGYWVQLNRYAMKSLVALLETVRLEDVCDVCKVILMIINNESRSVFSE